MAVLLTIVLSVLLFLTLEIVWCRPARDVPRSGSVQDLPDPQALPFIRHRLDVLAAELERLDDDPDIFAKAFRTNAARSAYRALIEDATRLAEASRFVGMPSLPDVTHVEVDRPQLGAPVREELVV
jgi:hypothetical protein